MQSFASHNKQLLGDMLHISEIAYLQTQRELTQEEMDAARVLTERYPVVEMDPLTADELAVIRSAVLG